MDVSDILYPRYTDIAQILLDQSATATNTAKSSRPKEKRKQPPDAVTASASKKKQSGPSNADEALKLRERLGIDSAKPSSASMPQAFSFAFAVNGNAGEHAETQAQAQELEDGDGAELPADTGKSQAACATEPQQPAASPKQGSSEADERLRRVMGEGAQSTERRVFVGGMPFSYEEDDVWDYWGYCGDIESLDLMRFPDTGRFKGICFITFKTEEGYAAALECNEMMLDQTQLKVEPCISAGPKAKKKGAGQAAANGGQHRETAPKVEGYNVAYIGNIAFEAGEDDLRGLMSDCTITKVRLHTDRASGRFKGYAHVHFADEESLDRAMGYDGSSLKGRNLKIGYAQRKKEQA
ncbi:hypothetical protein CVIRNUC_008232 [Coccomyxa viridis]|uniref:RRM domain-containing protein n=1 Tax=Coccomyxa viridis TaxID=1274662 RepID=A0AAV1ID28_9CHLO|nr:hypothetical protein CVIRNUC_008232 [Coccomyxa viridis]